MAGKALRVIAGCIAYKLAVGIVASHATDPRVDAVVAAAIGETIGLEANVGDATPMTSDCSFPGAMALTAEVGHIFRRWQANLCWSWDGFGIGEDRQKMRVRIGVTALAGDARLHLCKVQVVIEDGMRCMTVEAGLRFLF